MYQSQAIFPTASGSRYLQQLCKHWAHKFPVNFTPEEGEIEFGEGRLCRLRASADALTMQAVTPDEAGLERLQDVIVKHVARFAFREDMTGVSWTRMEEAAR